MKDIFERDMAGEPVSIDENIIAVDSPAGAIPLQRPAEKKNRRLPPRKSPLTGGESCGKIGTANAKPRRNDL